LEWSILCLSYQNWTPILTGHPPKLLKHYIFGTTATVNV